LAEQEVNLIMVHGIEMALAGSVSPTGKSAVLWGALEAGV